MSGISVKEALEKILNNSEKPADIIKQLANEDIVVFEQALGVLAKAIKPGPTLDYKAMNPKPNYKEIENNAPTIDYGNNKPNIKPTWTGAAAKRDSVRAKLDAESKESALETMARKQKLNKEEPHSDDPKHEEKEKKKAKAIKEKADELLDMHKFDSEKMTVAKNGQWQIEKASKPHGQMTPEERTVANTPKNPPDATTTTIAGDEEARGRIASQKPTRSEALAVWNDKKEQEAVERPKVNSPKYDKEDDAGSKLDKPNTTRY